MPSIPFPLFIASPPFPYRKWPHLWVNKPSTLFFYWSASSSVIFNRAIKRLSQLTVLSIWFAGSLVKCTARGWQMNVHVNFNSTDCWENILILDYNNNFRLSWDCFLIIPSFISHKNVHSLGCEFYETSLWSHNKSHKLVEDQPWLWTRERFSKHKTWENRLYLYCALVIRWSAEEKLSWERPLYP